MLVAPLGGHLGCRRWVGVVVAEPQLRQGPIHIGVQVISLAEHLQHVAATPALLGVRRAQRGLQLDEDLALLLMGQRFRLRHPVDQIGQVGQRGWWRLW